MAKQTQQATPKELIRQRFVKAVRFIVDNYDDIGGVGGIAELFGCASSNLSRILNSEGYSPQLEWIGIMVNTFNVSAEWILTGNGEMFINRTIEKRLKRLEIVVARLEKEGHS